MKLFIILTAFLAVACSSKNSSSLTDTAVVSTENLAQIVKISGDGAMGVVQGSKTISLSFSNEGNENSGVLAPAVSGTDASAFQIVYTNGCSSVLKPKGLCAVKIYFNANGKVIKEYVASLNVGGLLVPLSAAVEAGSATATLLVEENSVAASALNFGSVVNAKTLTKNLKVTNKGTGPSGVLSVSLSNSNFSLIKNDCAKSLKPNESCIIRLALNPVGKSGSVTADLSISSASGGGGSGADAFTKVLLTMDGNLTDASSAPVSISGGVSFAAGKFGQGAVFTGSGSEVIAFAAGGNPAFTLGTMSFAAELWAKSPNQNGHLFGQGASCVDGWDFNVNAGTIYFAYYNVGYSLSSPPNLVTDGDWHHYAITKDEATHTLRLFLDGVMVAEDTNFHHSLANNGQDYMHIGGYNQCNLSNNMLGMADDFRLSMGTARYTSNFTPPQAGVSAGGLVSIPVAANVQVPVATGSAQGVILSALLNNAPISELDLGAIAEGEGASRLLNFKNTGAVSSAALSLSLSGADAASFSLVSNTCLNKILTSQATCSARLFFSSLGKAAGTYTANLIIGDKTYVVTAVVGAVVPPPPSSNEDDINTVLMLHFNGSNVDSSTQAHPMTTVPSPTYVTGKFGQALSVDDPGNGCVFAQSDSSLTLGTSDFTVEMWAKSDGRGGMLATDGVRFINQFWAFRIGSYDGSGFINNGAIEWIDNGSNIPNVSAPPGTFPFDNQFHHLAVVRQGSNLSLYLDGERIGHTINYAHDYQSIAGNPICIGGLVLQDHSQGEFFGGVIDEVRISKVARWSSDFTPPVEQYVGSNLSLLMHFDGNFQDSSPYEHAISVNGQALSYLPGKFNQGGAFSSGGSSTYVHIPSGNAGGPLDFEAQDFTIDFVANFSGGAGHFLNRWAYANGTGNDVGDDWFVYYSGSSLLFQIKYNNNSPQYRITINETLSGNHHIAIVRHGDDVRVYIDGVSKGAMTYPGAVPFTAATPITLGGFADNVPGLGGTIMIDELRISKGIARWTSDFIPPVAAY